MHTEHNPMAAYKSAKRAPKVFTKDAPKFSATELGGFDFALMIFAAFAVGVVVYMFLV